ncbi:MAG: CvpA family protein [Spirochaetaceae bacterium]|jgi:membrane protein required for colicin V production|nr:CvpA family protein [Spirochaetaceae bacterium]
MSVSMVDIVFIVLFCIIVLLAALRGFVTELTGTVWFGGGLLFAFAFFREGAFFIRAHFLSEVPYLPEILAFAGLFMLIVCAVKLAGGMLQEIVERANLKTIDHVAGLVFGFFKGIVVIAALIFIISIQPLFDGNKLLSESVIAKYLTPSRTFIEKAMEPRNV